MNNDIIYSSNQHDQYDQQGRGELVSVDSDGEDSEGFEGFDIISHSRSMNSSNSMNSVSTAELSNNTSSSNTSDMSVEELELEVLVNDMEDLVDGVLTTHDKTYTPDKRNKHTISGAGAVRGVGSSSMHRMEKSHQIYTPKKIIHSHTHTNTTANTNTHMLVIKLKHACGLTEAMGEMNPYFVFDWETLGTAHTQAVRSPNPDGVTMTGLVDTGDFVSHTPTIYTFESILKFRLPTIKPQTQTHSMSTTNTHTNTHATATNSTHSLYHFLLHAPALYISVYNRNESVSDELIGETSIPQLIDMYIKYKSIGLNSELSIANQSVKDAKKKVEQIKLGLDVHDVNIQLYKTDGSGDEAGNISIDMYLE